MAKTERVGNYRNGTECHGGAGNHGTEQYSEERIQNARGNWNSERVVYEGQKQILPDVLHRGATQRPCPVNPAKVPAKQRDSGAFHRNVGSAAHGNPNLSLCQRGSIVHTIAGHGDNVAHRLQLLDDLSFLLRKNFGPNFIESELACDGLRSRPAVSGQHDDANSVLP